MIQAGEREQALVTFMQEIVMITPSEITAMKARPSWPGLVASIESSIRRGSGPRERLLIPHTISQLTSTKGTCDRVRVSRFTRVT
jgi:hypothetical protein